MYKSFIQDKIFTLLKDVSVKGHTIEDKYIETILNKDYRKGYNLSLLQQSLVGENENLPFTSNNFINMLNDIKNASKKETTEGYAFITSYNKLKDIFILKTSKDKKEENTILYEYFTGIFGINKLRKIIPNFSCVLGLFQYYPPIRNNKSIVEFDKTKDKQYYVVYEKINGQSLNDTFINIKKYKRGNIDMVFSYILQIALVLAISQDYIQFVHYDLHTDNIILRDLPSPTIVEYVYRGKKYKILTDKIPTIIDYGFVHFNVDNDVFGNVTLPKLNIYSSVFNRSYDLHKFLMYSCGGLFDKKFIEFVFKFYNYDYSTEIKITDKLSEGVKGFFALTKEYNDAFPPEKFIDFFLKNIKYINVKLEIDEYIPLNESLLNFKDKIEYIGKINEFSKCSIKNYKSVVLNEYTISQMKNALKIVDNDFINKTIKELEEITKNNLDEYILNDKKRLNTYVYSLQKMKSINIDTIEKDIQQQKQFHELIKTEPTINLINNLLSEYENYRYFLSYSQLSTTKYFIDKELDDIYYLLKKLSFEYSIKRGNLLNYNLESNMYNLNIYKNDINRYTLLLRDTVFDFEYLKSDYTNTEDNLYKEIVNLNMNRKICLYVPPKSRLQIAQIWNSKSRFLFSKLLLKSFMFNDIKNVEDYIYSCLSKKMNDEDILLDLKKYDKQKERKDRTDNRIGKLDEIFSQTKHIITSDTKYLDIGCTDGEIAYEFGNSIGLQKEQIFGADVGDWKDVDQGEINPNITYIPIPKEGRLPFDDNSFDIITVLMVLHHIEYIDERLKEIYRILKPNGKLIIREHDCLSDENRIIHDLEHSIYEISKKEKIDSSYLNTYTAWYRSRDVWNKKLSSLNFTLFTSDGKTPNSATRGYYELYIKNTISSMIVEPYNIRWTTGILIDNFPRAPYFKDGKAYPLNISYSGLSNTTPTSYHWGQRKLLMSEIDFLTRLSKEHKHIVVYAGAADGRHIRVLADMFQTNVEFHLYDPRKFNQKLFGHPKIKLNPYYKDENEKDYGYFTDVIAEYYRTKQNVVFISDIRTTTKEEDIELNQRQQEKWIYIMNPLISMVKFKMPYPKYDGNDMYSYLDGEIRLQCWSPPFSGETRLIISPPFSNKKRDCYQYEQNMSWYNLVLRPRDFSGDNLTMFRIPINMTVREFWKRYIKENIVLGYDFVYELMIITNYLSKYGSTNYNEYIRLLDYINYSIMGKNTSFVSYLKSDKEDKDE